MFRWNAQDVSAFCKEIGVFSVEELAGAFQCRVGYPLSAKYIRDHLNFNDCLTLNYSRSLALFAIILQQDKHLQPNQRSQVRYLS